METLLKIGDVILRLSCIGFLGVTVYFFCGILDDLKQELREMRSDYITLSTRVKDLENINDKNSRF